MNPVVAEEQVHFNLSDPGGFNEDALREAFKKQDFAKIEVLKKPGS